MENDLIISFLIMLNPFALFLYLKDVIRELNTKDFLVVLFKASVISYVIYITFALFGNAIFIDFFKINFESFRIFGGIIIFAYAYVFIMKGSQSMITLKESLDDLSSEIALPFMVGAGTISLSVIIGYKNNTPISLFMIAIVMTLNYLIVILLKFLKDFLDKKMQRLTFDKYSSILSRVNGFIAGAIGIDMIIRGILAIWNSGGVQALSH